MPPTRRKATAPRQATKASARLSSEAQSSTSPVTTVPKSMTNNNRTTRSSTTRKGSKASPLTKEDIIRLTETFSAQPRRKPPTVRPSPSKKSRKERPPLSARFSPTRTRSKTKAGIYPPPPPLFLPSPIASPTGSPAPSPAESPAATPPHSASPPHSPAASPPGSPFIAPASVIMTAPVQPRERQSSQTPSCVGSTATTRIAGRVNKAVRLIEQKAMLDHAMPSPASNAGSSTISAGLKRLRSQDRDYRDGKGSGVAGRNQTFKRPRTDFHGGDRHPAGVAPTRTTRSFGTQTEGDNYTLSTFSFRVPAGTDPAFPDGFTGRFIVPSQVQTGATSDTEPPPPLPGSSGSVGIGSVGGLEIGINPGQDRPGIDIQHAIRDIAGAAETLLRHLSPLPPLSPSPTSPPRRRSSVPATPAIPALGDLMSDPSTLNFRQIPLRTDPQSNAVHFSLPAITLPLPVNALLPSDDMNEDTEGHQQLPEQVRLSLAFRVEGRNQNDCCAVLHTIDMEPLST
ncbi:hypothetical protein BGX33_009737 [Mortierella sp. NVP41]|nr:hypothetical protein BGX33_009737 [Mortierella sp. NVP41]